MIYKGNNMIFHICIEKIQNLGISEPSKVTILFPCYCCLQNHE